MGGTLASNTGSSSLRAYPSCPRMLQTLKELEARSSEAKATAFQHLLLLVGIHLFKVSGLEGRELWTWDLGTTGFLLRGLRALPGKALWC